MLVPDSFSIGIDKLLEKTVGTGMNGVSIGPHSFSDLDLPMMSLYLLSYLNSSYLHLSDSS